MELEDTLTYKYELAENPLKYKSTINIFPKKLNDRYAKYNLTAKEFNAIIKACIVLEKNILFFRSFNSDKYEFDEPKIKFLFDFINDKKLNDLKKDAEIFKNIDIEKIKTLKTILDGYILTSDTEINNNKNYFYKNDDNEYRLILNPQIDNISTYYEKIRGFNLIKIDYQIKNLETHVNFFKQIIKIYKNFLVHYKILVDDSFDVDIQRLKVEKNNLSKEIFLNYLKTKIKLIYFEKKLEIINRYII